MNTKIGKWCSHRNFFSPRSTSIAALCSQSCRGLRFLQQWLKECTSLATKKTKFLPQSMHIGGRLHFVLTFPGLRGIGRWIYHWINCIARGLLWTSSYPYGSIWTHWCMSKCWIGHKSNRSSVNRSVLLVQICLRSGRKNLGICNERCFGKRTPKLNSSSRTMLVYHEFSRVWIITSRVSWKSLTNSSKQLYGTHMEWTHHHSNPCFRKKI